MMDTKTLKEKYISPNFSDGAYHKARHIRDILFRRVAIVLTVLKITPNVLTITGIMMMVFFVFSIQISQVAALTFLIMSLSSDCLDGVLARYQHIASDRGKFFDVMADNFSSFLFALGLAIMHIVNPFIIIANVYFMLLGKVFKIYLNSSDYKSDWLFRPVAGFGTSLINYASYALFIAYVFVKFDLNTPFLIITIALMLYAFWHFIRIIRMKPKVDACK